MLSLGPGSSCDICFESFNASNKAPSSLTCGHVFCHMCIVQIRRLCPLCRVPFDKEAIVKLHIETENSPEHLHATQESIDQAKQFTSQIYKIADDGIAESQLQKLINDGRTFLGTQDRSMHRELRVLLRLLKYLNSVKLGARDQTHTIEILNTQVTGLEQEKEEIRKLLADAETTRQMERDTAYAVEESLRGHIKRIQEHSDKAAAGYLSLVELYNKVSLHNKELVNKVVNAGGNPGPLGEIYKAENVNILSTDPASLELVAPIVDRPSVKQVAVRKPGSSYLISPLPQFTVPLPNIDKFVPLPDLADDDEEEEEEDSEDEEDGLNTPDSGSNQGQFRDQYHQYPSRSQTMPVPPQPVPPIVLKPTYEPSGISRTAPYQEHRRRERSRSNPIDRVPLHCRNPQDDALAPSTPPTPPYPNPNTTEAVVEEPSSYRDPYAQPTSSSTALQQSSRHSTSQSYSHYSSKHQTSSNTPNTPQTLASEYPPMPMNEDRLSAHSNVHQMDPILRLQNILSSDPPTPSSLPSSASRPNPSSYSSRDRERERPPSPPTRGGSSTSHTQTPTPQTHQQQQQSHYQQQQYHHPQKQQQQQQYVYPQQGTQPSSSLSNLGDKSQYSSGPLTSSSSGGKPTASASVPIPGMSTKTMSTASAQARILEEEKRKRYEDEKRRRLEERYQAEERERREQQQQQESEARYSTKYVSASAAAAAASNTTSVSSNIPTSTNNSAATYPPVGSWQNQAQVYGPNVQMQMSSSPSGPTGTMSSSTSSKRSGSISNISNAYARMQ